MSLDNIHSLKLPTIIECDDIPNNRDEMPSPEVASQYPHLHDIAASIPPIDEAIEIELLIGRDLIDAYYVLDQRIGQNCLPYAQKLPFGWVILGHVCLGNTRLPEVVNTNKTHILPNGRISYLEPCDSKLSIHDVFLKTEQDDKIGLSVADQRFMKIMDSGFQKDSDVTEAKAPRAEVYIYSDASKEVIAAVAYLRTASDSSQVGFLLGKSKVAPKHGHTIPRLELCAAVLVVELAETITEQLDIEKECFHFHTDSKVVLGYISNESRRFYVYVTNLVSRIRSFCDPEQWNYVPTHSNQADLATRNFSASDLPQSSWIQGPASLHLGEPQSQNEEFPLVDAESDIEVVKEVNCIKTQLESKLGCERFRRFSTWRSLLRGIHKLKLLAKKHRSLQNTPTAETPEPVEHFIIKQVQRETFSEEIQAITEGRGIPRKSSLLPLNPIIDDHGILRVGGRTKRMSPDKVRDFAHHPIIIPKGHHVANLLIGHSHALVHHQGRHLDNECARNYWPMGIVDNVFESEDEGVRKAKIRVSRGDVQTSYVRRFHNL